MVNFYRITIAGQMQFMSCSFFVMAHGTQMSEGEKSSKKLSEGF